MGEGSKWVTRSLGHRISDFIRVRSRGPSVKSQTVPCKRGEIFGSLELRPFGLGMRLTPLPKIGTSLTLILFGATTKGRQIGRC